MNIFIRFKNWIAKLLKKEVVTKPIVNNDQVTTKLPLEFGDIVFLNRGEKIKEGHENGPYIISKVHDGYVEAFYGTSVIPEKAIWFVKFLFTESDPINGLNKNTVFKLEGLKKKYNNDFIKKIGHLNNMDLNELKIKMDVLNNRGYYSNHIDYLDFPDFDIKDVVLVNTQKYLIINKTEEEYHLIPVKINKFVYECSNEVRKISRNSKNVLRYDRLDDSSFKVILNEFEELNNKVQKQKLIQRGSLITDGFNLYYVYGVDGNDYLTFVVNKMGKGKYKISINNKEYFAEFYNSHRINSSTNPKLIECASEKEIESIKELKKTHQKTTLKNSKKYLEEIQKQKRLYKIVQPGSVIEDTTLAHTKYVVLDGTNDRLYACSIEDLLKCNKNSVPLKHSMYRRIKTYDDELISVLEEINKRNHKEIVKIKKRDE